MATAPTTSTKAGVRKISIGGWWTPVIFVSVLAVLLVVGAATTNGFHSSSTRGGQQNTNNTAYVPPQPRVAAPAGCRGPEPMMEIGAMEEVVLPQFCRFEFNVVKGTITLQGTDGSTIDVAKGEIVNFPNGFHPTRIWSMGGARITVEFYPT